MKPLSAGEKDQYVTIQSRAAGQNTVGQANGAWGTHVQLWAQALPVRGSEYFAAGQVQSDASVRFRIDFREDITPRMRVLWRGVAHDIDGVIDVMGRRTVLELMCTAGRGDGA